MGIINCGLKPHKLGDYLMSEGNDQDSFGRIIGQMQDAYSRHAQGELDRNGFKTELIRLDSSLSNEIRNAFNVETGILIDRSAYKIAGFGIGPLVDISETLHDSHAENAERYLDNTSRRAVLDALRFKVPELNDLDLATSMDITRKIIERDPSVQDMSKLRLAAAFAIVTNSQADIKRDHPEFNSIYQQNRGSIYFRISSYLVEPKERIDLGPNLRGDPQTLDTPEEFGAYQEERQRVLLDRLVNHEALNSKISQIKPFINVSSRAEYEEQYTLRQDIAEITAGIYGEVYQLPNIDGSDIYTPHLAYDNARDAVLAGFQSGRVGVENDDYVILNNSVTAEFLRGSPITTRQGAVEEFLNTLHEELSHLTDASMSDALLHGDMDESDPRFEHTAINVINRTVYYPAPEPNPTSYSYGTQLSMYEGQYTERNPKEHSAAVTSAQMEMLAPLLTAPDTEDPNPDAAVISNKI